MSEMVCKICNQQVENRMFVQHLATHMISPKDYYDSIYGVHHCPICGKTTNFKDVFITTLICNCSIFLSIL